jgi:chlorite dismutase
MANPLLVQFVGGTVGRFAVTQARAIAGEGLARVSHVDVREAPSLAELPAPAWLLRGVTSHQRYVERAEGARLRAIQAGLGRAEATHAALIPIRKSAAWWELAQDERRAIFEARSQHIAGTLKYLPAIARRLHHARDLGEPFDFVTWFEFAPEHAGMFDELLGTLRSTEEWNYVEREVELRLVRQASAREPSFTER